MGPTAAHGLEQGRRGDEDLAAWRVAVLSGLDPRDMVLTSLRGQRRRAEVTLGHEPRQSLKALRDRATVPGGGNLPALFIWLLRLAHFDVDGACLTTRMRSRSIRHSRPLPESNIMTEDLTGTWEGIYATALRRLRGVWWAPSSFDVDPKIRQTGDVVAADHGVRLVIAVSERTKSLVTSRALLVSIVAGQIEYLGGCRNVRSRQRLCLPCRLGESKYLPERPAIGPGVCRSPDTHGLTREISGNVMTRWRPPGRAWPDLYPYYFGRLSVRNNGLGLNDDRAYTVDYGHVF
jgi:hypothetical protein